MTQSQPKWVNSSLHVMKLRAYALVVHQYGNQVSLDSAVSLPCHILYVFKSCADRSVRVFQYKMEDSNNY
jgi:hypothetical protein